MCANSVPINENLNGLLVFWKVGILPDWNAVCWTIKLGSDWKSLEEGVDVADNLWENLGSGVEFVFGNLNWRD